MSREDRENVSSKSIQKWFSLNDRYQILVQTDGGINVNLKSNCLKSTVLLDALPDIFLIDDWTVD